MSTIILPKLGRTTMLRGVSALGVLALVTMGLAGIVSFEDEPKEKRSKSDAGLEALELPMDKTRRWLEAERDLLSAGQMRAAARKAERNLLSAGQTLKDEDHSQQPPPPCSLDFVHITKTGGTSIKVAAKNSGIDWGVNKFVSLGIRTYKCSYPGTPPWHCPPHAFLNGDPYGPADTFVVVRNPYDRIISEYYYYCKVKHGKCPKPDDVDHFNEWIAIQLNQVKNTGACAMGHCIPYSKYVFSNETQIIDHVLHFENMDDDFDKLMSKYDLDIKLGGKVNEMKRKKMEVANMTRDTVELVNEWAMDDFVMFEYDMLDPKDFPK